MNKSGVRWNKDKRANQVSLKTIREANTLLRLLNSAYAKDNNRQSILANNVMANLRNKKENRLELYKELKRQKKVASFMKHIDSPNNIYKIVMNQLNNNKD